MGQRKGSRKSATATAEETSRKSTSGVTPLRATNKPASSAKTTTMPKTEDAKGPTHEQIAQRAHELWVKNGSAHGEDQRYWLEAEAQLKKEMGLR